MKRLFALLLMLAMLVSFALAEGDEHKFEGDGFATAEEAAMAYLDGMKAGDVEAMLETFAIESYVDNADPEALMQRMHAFVMTANSSVRLSSPYIRQIEIGRRYGNLCGALYTQFLTYSGTEVFEEDLQRPVYWTKSENIESDINAFLNGLAEEDISKRFADMEFIELLRPEDIPQLSEGYSNHNTQRSLQMQATNGGYKEPQEFALRFRMDGVDYLQFISCGKYGERWYNIATNSILSNLAGCPATSNGLIPMSELEG